MILNMLVNIRVVDKILTKDFITLMTYVHNKHIFYIKSRVHLI